MNRLRVGGVCLVLICLGLLALSVPEMVQRIKGYYEKVDLPEYILDPILKREFTFMGHRVTLRDGVDEHGRSVLDLTYGDVTEQVPVKRPPAHDPSSLGLYDEWCAVLAVRKVERDEHNAMIPRQGHDRCIIVTRRTPEGYDPDAWGAVRRSEWAFAFYELMPDGSIEKKILGWPTTKRWEQPREDEIRERTLEWQAALAVIPKLNRPRQAMRETAMHATGWTLPVSSFSVLGIVWGGVLIASGGRLRKRREQMHDAATSPPQ